MKWTDTVYNVRMLCMRKHMFIININFKTTKIIW